VGVRVRVRVRVCVCVCSVYNVYNVYNYVNICKKYLADYIKCIRNCSSI